MSKLLDLLNAGVVLQKIEGNTEVAAEAALESKEILNRIADTLTRIAAASLPMRPASQTEAGAARVGAADEGPSQAEQLEREEQANERAKVEESRWKKMLDMFKSMLDKIRGVLSSRFVSPFTKIISGLVSLLGVYLLPFIMDFATRILPTLAKGITWVFDTFMGIGESIGGFFGKLFGNEGLGAAIGNLAGLAAALALLIAPIKALTLAFRALNLIVTAAKAIWGRMLGPGGGGAGGGAGDVVADGPGRRRRGSRGARLPTRAAVGGAAGRTAVRAIPIVGTAASVGLGAYTAYSDVREIDKAVASGEMTEDEARVAKGEAVGGAAGEAGGALAGAALGAQAGGAIGALFGGVGAIPGALIGGALGGIVGAVGGRWLGESAGASVAAGTAAGRPLSVAPTPTASDVLDVPTLWAPRGEGETEFLQRMFKEQVDYLLRRSTQTPLHVMTASEADARRSVAVIDPTTGLPVSPVGPTGVPGGGRFGAPLPGGGGVNPILSGGTPLSGALSPFRTPAGSAAPAGTTSIPTTRLPAASSPTGPMSADAFADLIGKKESNNDYSAYNQLYTDERGRRRSRAMYGTNLTSMTLGEVMQAQAEGRVFAAGRFQLIPSTLREAAAHLRLDPSAKFDAAMQDRIFKEYLIKVKRPQIGEYLAGRGSLEAATLAAAREWASVGVPAGIRLANGRISQGGESYYAGDGLNKAHISVEQVQQALKSSRQATIAGAPAPRPAGAAVASASRQAAPAIAPAPRPTGTAVATTSRQNALAASAPASSTSVVSAPVNAPTTIVQGGRQAPPRRTTTPPAAVAYDVGAIA